jgi:hypothetical protein
MELALAARPQLPGRGKDLTKAYDCIWNAFNESKALVLAARPSGNRPLHVSCRNSGARIRMTST